MKLFTILQIFVLECYCTGIRAKITVISGLWAENEFECNSEVILRCHVPPNTYHVQWSFGYSNEASVDGECFVFGCSNSIQFPGRYSYTYDAPSGTSDLKITHSTFEDDKMIYRCFADTENSFSLNAISVKAPPKFDTTTVIVRNTTNHITATLRTGCIYPVEDISLNWFSTSVDGSDIRKHQHTDPKQVSCSPSWNCLFANTSVESDIDITATLTTAQERLYFVNIGFGHMNFTTPVGRYNKTLDPPVDTLKTRDRLATGTIVGIVTGCILAGAIPVTVVVIYMFRIPLDSEIKKQFNMFNKSKKCGNTNAP